MCNRLQRLLILTLLSTMFLTGCASGSMLSGLTPGGLPKMSEPDFDEPQE